MAAGHRPTGRRHLGFGTTLLPGQEDEDEGATSATEHAPSPERDTVGPRETGEFFVVDSRPSGDPQSDQGAAPSGAPPAGVSDTAAAAAAGAAESGATFGATELDADEDDAAVAANVAADAADAAAAAAAGDAAASSPGAGGGTAGVGTPDAFKRGGLVRNRTPGRGDNERIVAQDGEYVMNRDAVKKYGLRFMESLNRGRVAKVNHDGYMRRRNGHKPPPRHTMLRGA